MKPLVSVFLISYNEEQYIRQALDSILAQNINFDFEILCHDDASTDNTANIILEYAERYPNIVIPILQKENQTQKSENIVLKFIYPKAKGKYVAYCDGDDYWTDKNKLQKQVDFLERNPEYTLCLHNFEFLYENSGKIKSADCGKLDSDFRTEKFIQWDSSKIPQIGTSMFPKDLAYNRPKLFHKVGGGKESMRPISDMPLYIYLSIVGKVKYFPKPMSIWRRRAKGTWETELKDVSKMTTYNKQHIEFLKQLDVYTEYKYKESIQKKINNINVEIAYREAEFRRVRQYIWSSNMNCKRKLFMSAGCVFPKLAKRILIKRYK